MSTPRTAAAAGASRIARMARPLRERSRLQCNQQQQRSHRPDQVVEALRRVELEAEHDEARNAADAERAAGEPVPLEKQDVSDDGQRQRGQRQKIARQPQDRPADRDRYRGADADADREARGRRPAELRGAVGACCRRRCRRTRSAPATRCRTGRAGTRRPARRWCRGR